MLVDTQKMYQRYKQDIDLRHRNRGENGVVGRVGANGFSQIYLPKVKY